MKKSELKTLIREEILNEEEVWNTKHLVDIKKAINLASKTLIRAQVNMELLQLELNKHTNRFQGDKIARMVPSTHQIDSIQDKLGKIPDGFELIFKDQWANA